jgi:protein TonB
MRGSDCRPAIRPRRSAAVVRWPSIDPEPVLNEVAEGDPAPAVVVPAAESAPAVVSDPDLNAQYAAQLRTNIDRRTPPPDTLQYRLQHPSGEVRVRFTVTRGGEPQAVSLLRSSGYPLLDSTALNIVSSGHSAPMGPKVFVGEMQHVFVVTIEFRPQMRAAL